MKKRILVDMDGVLTDVYARLFEIHRNRTGISLTINDVAGMLEEEAFPGQRDWVSEPGFFRNLPVMEGSSEILEELNTRYEIIIVSLATEFPNSLTDKMLWIQVHFPFISWKQVVFCGDKSLLDADILIDDHPKNLDRFKGRTIMFTQPHNMLTETRHRRAGSWNEIKELLLQKEPDNGK